MSQEVIKWNEVARKNPPSEIEQEHIVRSEIQELMDAIKAQDFVEELDAIADIFFTGAYMDYLYPDNPVNKEVERVMAEAADCYGIPIVIETIEEVIRSNYSKFTPFYKGLDPNKERLWIENKTGDFIRVYASKDLYVYLDERNKVRKPSHYEEPDIKAIVDKYKNKIEER